MPNTLTVASFNANLIRVRLNRCCVGSPACTPTCSPSRKPSVLTRPFPPSPSRAAGYHVVPRQRWLCSMSRCSPGRSRRTSPWTSMTMTNRMAPLGAGARAWHRHRQHLHPPGARDHLRGVSLQARWFARLRCLFERRHYSGATLIWLGDLTSRPSQSTSMIPSVTPTTWITTQKCALRSSRPYPGDLRTSFGAYTRTSRSSTPIGITVSATPSPTTRAGAYRPHHGDASLAAGPRRHGSRDERLAARPSDHTLLTAQFI